MGGQHGWGVFCIYLWRLPAWNTFPKSHRVAFPSAMWILLLTFRAIVHTHLGIPSIFQDTELDLPPYGLSNGSAGLSVSTHGSYSCFPVWKIGHILETSKHKSFYLASVFRTPRQVRPLSLLIPYAAFTSHHDARYDIDQLIWNLMFALIYTAMDCPTTKPEGARYILVFPTASDVVYFCPLHILDPFSPCAVLDGRSRYVLDGDTL